MSPQLFVAGILAAMAAITVGTWQMMRAQAPTLTVAALNTTAESTAAGLLATGTVPSPGQTWTASDAAGDSITYTVVASSTTSITLKAQSGSLVAEAGAHAQ